MSPLTDDFDVVIQIHQGAIGRVLRAMHDARAMEHHFVHAHAGKRVELQLDAPQVALDTTPGADGRARALVKSRVRLHTRDLADPADPGTSATADVTVRGALRISISAPGAPVRFSVDPGETTRADIAVHGATGAAAREIEDALQSFITDHVGGVFTAPALGDGSRPAVALGLRFLAAPTGTPVAALGVSLGGAARGSAAGLTQAVVHQDWALALSQRYVLDRIYEGLGDKLGALPPPRGSGSVVLSQQEICVIPSPFGCIDSAQQTVLLERLEATLVPGSIVIEGKARNQVDSWMVPDVTATFRLVATLSVDRDGRLVVAVGDVSTKFEEWYADVADFLSGDKLEAAVRQGIYAALQGSAQGELSSLFSAGLLSAVTSLGKIASVKLTPSPASVEVRADAIVVHGALSTPAPAQRPYASLEASRVPGALTRRRFHSGESWAPGAGIARYAWDFGDGQSLIFAGDDARFVAAHDYAPGHYTASVTVTDDRGCSSKAEVTVRPSALMLERLDAAGNAIGWTLSTTTGAFTATFRVTEEDGNVPGATVTVSAHTWSEERTTGTDGCASFVLDQARFNDDKSPGQGASGFLVKTWVVVTASKPGYAADSRTLCTGDSLPDIGFWAALRRRLLDWLDWPVQYGRPGGERVNPSVRETLKEVSLSLDALGSVLDLAERGSEVLPIHELCGFDRLASRSALVERLSEVMTQTEQRLTTARARLERDAVRGAATDPPKQRPKPIKIRDFASRAKLKRSMPHAAGLSGRASAVYDDARRALGTLGKLALVAERGAHFLPLATLLGAASDEAVADKLSTVASSMGQNLDVAEAALATMARGSAPR